MAKKSFGTIVKVGGSTGTTVGELYSVTPPSLDYGIVETTHHGQSDRLRTFISTVGDWGEMELEMAMSAATVNQFNALLGVDNTSFYIAFEFGGTDITMTFTGIVTKFQPCGEAPIDGKYVCTATVKVSGDITWTGVP